MPALLSDRDLFRKELEGARLRGRRVGFVPTMGALHAGHASLIERSSAECDVTAVSIFVNPLQFGSAGDFDRYPRHPEADLAVAGEAGADIVFAPTPEALWPCGAPEVEVRPTRLADRLEGASRPGHFTGVCTVVATLLGLAGPCRAYFGEKDFQQLVVVGRLVDDLGLPAEVVGCRTVREPDGLACSSRNRMLPAEDRRAASVLHRALRAAAAAFASGVGDPASLAARMRQVVAAEARAVLDYAEVVDPATLAPLREVAGDARLLVAATFGPVRLIDNLGLGEASGA